MRPTMVGLLTFLLLAGVHARVQVLGPIDPTDLKVRVLTSMASGASCDCGRTQEC